MTFASLIRVQRNLLGIRSTASETQENAASLWRRVLRGGNAFNLDTKNVSNCSLCNSVYLEKHIIGLLTLLILLHR